MYRNHYGILLLVVFFVVLGVVGFYLYQERSDPKRFLDEDHNLDVAATREYWNQRIQRSGPVRAYDEFKVAYGEQEQRDPIVAHTAAHVMGELLYESLGMEAIAVCDVSYLSGCFHQIPLSVVTTEGEGMIPKLQKICREKAKSRLSCFHGMGHGIGAYLGVYKDIEKLNKALLLCGDLEIWKDGYRGCPSGLFMEYHFSAYENMLNRNLVMYEDNPDRYHEPCIYVDPDLRPGCYFVQTSWWRNLFARDYAKVALLCNELDTPHKAVCYYGLGANILYDVGNDADDASDICFSLSSKIESTTCMEGVIRAAERYGYDVAKRKSIDMLCGGDVVSSSYCLSADADQ